MNILRSKEFSFDIRWASRCEGDIMTQERFDGYVSYTACNYKHELAHSGVSSFRISCVQQQDANTDHQQNIKRNPQQGSLKDSLKSESETVAPVIIVAVAPGHGT